MMIIIVMKASIETCYNLLILPPTVSNTYAQVSRAQSYANHILHTRCISWATCVPCAYNNHITTNNKDLPPLPPPKKKKSWFPSNQPFPTAYRIYVMIKIWLKWSKIKLKLRENKHKTSSSMKLKVIQTNINSFFNTHNIDSCRAWLARLTNMHHQT